MTPKTNSRNGRLDSIKFFLIILVAFGHLIESSNRGDAGTALYSIIYAFHMPLFVLLSGYFTNVTDIQKLHKRTLMLIETYVVVMGLQFLYFRGIAQLFVGENSGWYLISLVTWSYIAFGLSKLKITPPPCLLIFSVVISYICFGFGFGKYEVLFSYMRTTQFLPFFICGYILKGREMNLIEGHKLYKILATILLLVVMAGLFYYSGRTLHMFEFHRNGLQTLMALSSLSIASTYAVNSIVYLVAAYFCFYIIKILPLPEVFAKYGRYSLVFYTMQGVFGHIFAKWYQPNLLESTLFTLVLILSTCLICDRGFGPYVTNPISTFIKNKNHGIIKQ